MSDQHRSKQTRRDFLSTSGGVVASGLAAPYIFSSQNAEAAEKVAKKDKLNVAAIGVGGRGSHIGHQAARLGNMIACCDVDSKRVGNFAKRYGAKCKTYEDYRKILDREDIDAVTIGTPDHWHSKIAIEAMQAGKDVYCEKPLTLTIDEGKQICKVVKETKKVFQVGTQQRTEYNRNFVKAVAIAQSGRLGKITKAVSSVGQAKSGGPFNETAPPKNLNWDMWLGQAPKTKYIEKRVHYQFRWWLEYSGGQVTDWGVHHTDIAMWALGLQNTGPISIAGKGTFDKRKNCYNVASTFDCTMKFATGQTIVLTSGKNELLIFGEKGKIRVNRGGLTGKVVEEIAKDPEQKKWLNKQVVKVYGKRPTSHMQNFYDCIKSRELPISDVFTHHRSVSACHLSNIAMQLGRELKWDPKKEDFIGDKDATAMLKREQRKGYEIKV